MSAKESTADREIVLSRIYDAPRELVFAAYTEPRHLKHWWGPRGYSITVHSMDFRVGGAYRFMMHAPDGTNYPNLMQYQEIVRPERIVFLHGSDERPGMFKVTISFAEKGRTTEVTQHMLFPTAKACEEVKAFGAVELGKQTLEKLSEYLAGDGKMIEITRRFAASPEQVFAAWTDAAQLARWFAPRGCRIEYRTLDVRPGGKFHSVIHDPKHGPCWAVGTYSQVVPGQKIVFSMALADEWGVPVTDATEAGKISEWPPETTVTILFEKDGTGTKLTLQQTVNEALAKKTGAYPGWISMLERLDDLLAQSLSAQKPTLLL
jgi:uncharacterized protein YndB with AHSA1/START domain